MYTINPTNTTPVAEPTGDHQALWLLNSLMVERATAADTAGAYTIYEQWITADGNPPAHVHEHEDEAFLVLEGSIDVWVDGTTAHLEPGGFAFGPRGVPHTYAVTSDLARILVIASPGGCEEFFRDLGNPAEDLMLPTPVAPDVARVVTVAAEHGIKILPPPA